MNHTGTYMNIPGQGVVKVSEEIPSLTPAVYAPKGDIPHYDRSAMRQFESKADKRQWMQKYGLKEMGTVKPDSRWGWTGESKNPRKSTPTSEQIRLRKISQDYVASKGGTEGLLKRIANQEGHFV